MICALKRLKVRKRILLSSFKLYIHYWVCQSSLQYFQTNLAATLIVNFLVAIIDESNRIAKQTPKDPDFLEFISFTIKVSFHYSLHVL